jgi:hypothetical protein
MADTFERAVGQATIAGTPILTAAAGNTLTIVGLRAANTSTIATHTIHFKLNSTLINGEGLVLPARGAYEFLDGGKIIAVATDVITAFSDTNNEVDVIISYLQEAP